MTVSLYDLAIDTFTSMLGTLGHLMDKAAGHAAHRQVDVATLVDARLAPDMFPLSSQIQIACYHARDATARLTGQTPPQIEVGPESFAQLVARVQATLAYVGSVARDAFEGAEDRAIHIDINPDMRFDMTGLQLLRDWSLPHFYFHVVTAYDILRHLGVDLGKRDYVLHMARYRPR